MKNTYRQSTLSLALAATLLGSATWSTASYACSPDPYLTDICVMALTGGQYASGFNEYLPAAGQVLQVSQYNAVYALIGNTYGGSAPSSFALPDMRGRVIVGAGQAPGLPNYVIGQMGGAIAVQLTVAQLPAHAHTLNANTAIAPLAKTAVTGTFTATTTLSGLTTTTNLAGVTFTSSSSSLSIKALSTNGSNPAPTTGSYMAKSSLASATVYTTSPPDTVMAPGSVVGTVSGTLNGTAPGTATGTANTTISGAPTVTISGQTDSTAAPTATVPIMPPYLSMRYFIAVKGIYPMSN